MSIFTSLQFWRRQILSTVIGVLMMTTAPIAVGQQGKGLYIEGVSVSATAQIAALLADKEQRTKAQQKVDSQLLYGARMSAQRDAAPGVPSLELSLRFVDSAAGQLVEVDIRTNPISKANAKVEATILALGGQIITNIPQFNAIHAALPISQVEALAELDEVRFIANAPMRETDVGSVTSEGDKTHAADVARTTYAPNVGGMKVCVISDSATAAGIANSVANGNLSAGQVTVLPGQDGTGTNEGIAMLEIVNDIAPGTKLYFATSGNSEAAFAKNILDLHSTYKCDVMVDDIRFSGELPFQDAVIARAVNTVTAAGTVYFASAGNSGNKTDGTSGTWVGDFFNGGAFTVPGVATSYEVHSFQTIPSVQNYNVVNSGGPSYFLSLFWSDPENGSTNDYDVFQLNSTGMSVVSSSTTTQNGTQNPSEFAALASGGGNRVVVVRKIGAANRALYVSTGRGRLAINTNGFARGHSAAIDAIATAAVPASVAIGGGQPTGPFPAVYTASQLTENFSSDGPARKFHHPDGTPVSPGNFLVGTGGGLTQQYPVVTAADGVTTSVPGFAPFYGTSAAAPHAAAIAALIKGYNPTLTASQIRNIMVATALDIEAVGADNDTGAGILRPVNALATVVASAGAYPGAVAAPTAESYAPANTFVDPGETVTLDLPITNIGSAGFNNLVATLLPNSGVSPGPTNPQIYGAISSGSTITRPFAFTASGVCGDTIVLTLQLQDGPTNFGSVTYLVTLGTTQTTSTTIENFDGVTAPALPAGWASTVVSGSGVNWATSTLNSDSGFNSVFGSPTSALSETRLDSPAFAVPNGGVNRISFRHRWNTENGYDGGVLEIAIGGGAFADIVAAGGSFVSGAYTSTISGNFGSTIGGRQAWSGSSDAAYTTTVVALPVAANGQNIRLRFRLASDNSTLASGTNVWRIDTLQRLTIAPLCATNGGIATTVAMSATGPIHRGQQSTVTATVSSSSGTPPGAVSVTAAGANCNVTLVSGTGTCQLNPTVVGAAQTVTGNYAGSGGYSSSSGSASLTVKSTLDVDNNGFSDAAVDGLLTARYLLGHRGAALTQNVTLGLGAQRTDPAAITNYLNEVVALLDIDGDTHRYLLTDGLLIVRYLLGIRGSALVQGSQGVTGATRTNFTDVQNYLQGLIQ